MAYQRQLDLFRTQIPPCGRGCSSLPYCELERRPTSNGVLTCIYCNCIAPGGITVPSSW
jgi:hypothetical protein